MKIEKNVKEVRTTLRKNYNKDMERYIKENRESFLEIIDNSNEYLIVAGDVGVGCMGCNDELLEGFIRIIRNLREAKIPSATIMHGVAKACSEYDKKHHKGMGKHNEKT